MKLIQICASQNDLFGLDADGAVHHYNFNTNSWIALSRGRPQHAASLPGQGGDSTADREAWKGAGSERSNGPS
jgi:hypothetical protein